MQVAATYSFDRPSASIHANAKDEKRSAGSAQSPTEKLAVEGAQSPTLTVLKATMVEPAPEAEIPTISTGGTRAQLSKVEKDAVEGARSPPYTVLETGESLPSQTAKLAPKPRKSCRECRQSPATVKGDRTFVECTLSTCSAGFSGYQSELYHAPGKFCSRCLVRRYAYPPAAIDPATFKCPICTNAQICVPSADAAATKKSKASSRTRAPAAKQTGDPHRKAASTAGAAGAGIRKRSRVRPAKRRQATPMTPLLSVGTAVVTEEGLPGVVRGSGNGFFTVELTSGDAQGVGDRRTAAPTSSVVVKRRGTALQLKSERPRSGRTQNDSEQYDSDGGQEDNDGDATPESESKGSLSHDASSGGCSTADAAMSASVEEFTEAEQVQTYTGGLRASDVLRYIATQHPQVLQEAVDATSNI
eukprot:COSAG02_NODE_11142_length_1784_cov_1.554896_1_plen_417_part_00